MAIRIKPPQGTDPRSSKHYYNLAQTIFEVDSCYQPTKAIGRGSYGVVCSSIDTKNLEDVAIKKIQNVFSDTHEAIRILREIVLPGKLKHPNVIALKNIMRPLQRHSFNDVYLVYELMEADLGHILWKTKNISDDQCRCLLYQILCGLKYIHSPNVLHRDLKPENLLVNSKGDLKIADFDLARTAGDNESMTDYVVTRWYRAPELLLLSDHYESSIDVWSVGCIFAEILGRKPIFPGTSPLNRLQLIVKILGTPHESDLEFLHNPKLNKLFNSFPLSTGSDFSEMFPGANPLALDLLQRMLVFNPWKRITVEEALKHPYMEQLHDPSTDIPAKHPIHLDFDSHMDEKRIRQRMYDEILACRNCALQELCPIYYPSIME